MISICLVMLLAITVMQLDGMEKNFAKRRLFSSLGQEENKDENSVPVLQSPTKGYRTETDPGTPVLQKKKMARLRMLDVTLTNLSGRPVLVAYLGSSGQAHNILDDFNTSKSKAKAHLSTHMDLLKGEIYISAIPEQFKIELDSLDRLLISKVRLPMAQETGGFIIVGDMPYPFNGKLTIKVTKGLEPTEPIILDMQ